jgi:hypothetical protein
MMDAKCFHNPDECIHGNTLALFKPTDCSWRDAGFLSELCLCDVTGEPYAFQAFAESSFHLIACCDGEVYIICHLLLIKLLKACYKAKYCLLSGKSRAGL